MYTMGIYETYFIACICIYVFYICRSLLYVVLQNVAKSVFAKGVSKNNIFKKSPFLCLHFLPPFLSPFFFCHRFLSPIFGDTLLNLSILRYAEHNGGLINGDKKTVTKNGDKKWRQKNGDKNGDINGGKTSRHEH